MLASLLLAAAAISVSPVCAVDDLKCSNPGIKKLSPLEHELLHGHYQPALHPAIRDAMGASLHRNDRVLVRFMIEIQHSFAA